MCSVRLTLTTPCRNAVERHLKMAQPQGHWRQVKSLLASLAIGDGRSVAEVATVLRGHEQSVAAGGRGCCCDGSHGAPRQKPPGRPPELPPTHQEALATLMDEAPLQAGLSSACWRSPMIPQLIDDRFGVFSNIVAIAPWLKNLGLRYQKAALLSDPLNDAKRPAWCTTTWPQIRKVAKAPHALRLFGDAASFPQGGPLADTWARRGHQPMGKTSGQRQGCTVFGVLESCTGRFWSQGQEGRLTSDADIAFLTRVLEQTTHPILLIQDGATYHPSAAMQRFWALPPERLTVCQLPSDSPDDQPIEKLWKNVKQDGTHLPYFPTFEALTDQVEPALLTFAHTPEEILSLCSLPTEMAKVA